MTKQQDSPPLAVYNTHLQRIQVDLQDIKADMRDLRAEMKSDRQELWSALNDLRESISGNSREGLVVRVDRNTGFRKTITRLLWVLFVPLYGGLIALLLKTLFNQ